MARRASDIFPVADNVSQWSIYIVGKNKQILLSQDNLGLSGDTLLNKKYNEVLRGPNAEFFIQCIQRYNIRTMYALKKHFLSYRTTS